METKKHVDVNQLVHAREKALSQEQFALRPLGKLWGMDVFTWYNASCENIASTIAAFPFPVIWFANARLVEQMQVHDVDLLKSLHWLGQYDSAKMLIEGKIAAYIPLVTTTENLNDSLTFLKDNKQEKHALLFTANGPNWNDYKTAFEQFVKLHQ
jgi:hypothetical protein